MRRSLGGVAQAGKTTDDDERQNPFVRSGKDSVHFVGVVGGDFTMQPGGILLLQAPWGGGVPSHLDEAIIDFYQNGGKSFISKRFKKIYSMAAMDISGVWQKK